MTDKEILARFNELVASVKSKHLAADILLIDTAMEVEGQLRHANWCAFDYTKSVDCNCGKFLLRDACELKRQVESGER